MRGDAPLKESVVGEELPMSNGWWQGARESRTSPIRVHRCLSPLTTVTQPNHDQRHRKNTQRQSRQGFKPSNTATWPREFSTFVGFFRSRITHISSSTGIPPPLPPPNHPRMPKAASSSGAGRESNAALRRNQACRQVSSTRTLISPWC